MDSPEPAQGKRLYGVLKHERLNNVVARELGIAIVSGRYAPGDVLPGEMTASEELRISRPVYREAVKALAAKGLVESRPKAGTIVCPRERWNLIDPEVIGWILENAPDQQFLDELFELRLMVEPGAAAMASERRSDADLARMAEAIDAMRANEPDSPAGQAADERFHEAVLAATRNRLVIRLASIIGASVGFVAEYKREQRVMRDPTPDHEALFRSIEARNAPRAQKIMRNLIEHAREDTILEPKGAFSPMSGMFSDALPAGKKASGDA